MSIDASPAALLADQPQAGAWLVDAVGYEIYIRSFRDSTGNGVGDLAGITSQIDYLETLGVDLLWITPFYTSPMADFGYDVADYCAIEPIFGDLDDFERLLDAAHAANMRVIVDIVPNHSSTEHIWFRESAASRDAVRRDFYHWSDPGPDGGPPNNWVSYFGGPAWTLHPETGQYYLHLFLPEQADLNWGNPAVIEAFDEVLRFWLDRGIDGFRIDVAQALVKDQALRSNPQIAPWDPAGSRWEQWDAFDHQFDILQPSSVDIFARWRRIVDEYDAVLVGETYVLEPQQLAHLVRTDGLNAGFWFAPMHMEWDPQAIKTALQGPSQALANQTQVGWVAACHDEQRPPTRFGGGDLGRRRSLMLATLLMSLPGTPFLYQGEELGLEDGVVPPDAQADPVGSGASLSRDGCRTPMPWQPGPGLGFTTSPTTWLPFGGRSDQDTAAVQVNDEDSWFHRYRTLIKVRRLHPELRGLGVEWPERADDVLAIRRDTLLVLANAGDGAPTAEVGGEIVFSTHGRTGVLQATDVLAPAEAVIIRSTD